MPSGPIDAQILGNRNSAICEVSYYFRNHFRPQVRDIRIIEKHRVNEMQNDVNQESGTKCKNTRPILMIIDIDEEISTMRTIRSHLYLSIYKRFNPRSLSGTNAAIKSYVNSNVNYLVNRISQYTSDGNTARDWPEYGNAHNAAQQ